MSKREIDKENNNVANYDSSLNNLSLNVLSTVQSDVLMSVLKKLGR